VAAYREQTVEIALGRKGAFENDNVGILTRRVAAERVISALPSKDRNRKPPKPPRTPRVVELLRKALEWQASSNPAKFAIRPRSPAGRASPGLA
jgi:hypothetical protein